MTHEADAPGVQTVGLLDRGGVELSAVATAPPTFTFSERGKRFVIIHADGRVEIPDGVAVDDAARVFWDAVQAVAGWKPKA